jgi:hypothetical protein
LILAGDYYKDIVIHHFIFFCEQQFIILSDIHMMRHLLEPFELLITEGIDILLEHGDNRNKLSLFKKEEERRVFIGHHVFDPKCICSVAHSVT